MSNLHPIASKGFNLEADAYAPVPTYPSEALDQLKALLSPDAKILDLAAGTGIMTKLLIDSAGFQYISAVEPVDGMRHKLHSLLPKVPALKGTSTAIPLETQSLDAVIVAQAFHWFADMDSLREIHRVLKPGGYLVLLWNLESKERSEWVRRMRDCYEVFDQGVPQYRSGLWHRVFETEEAKSLFDLPLKRKTFTNDYMVHRSDVCRRVQTKTYIASLPNDQKNALQKDLEAILDNPESGFETDSNGYVLYPHDTEMVWAQTKKK